MRKAIERTVALREERQIWGMVDAISLIPSRRWTRFPHDGGSDLGISRMEAEMRAIRKTMTLDSDVIRISGLSIFRGRRVEIIILDNQDEPRRKRTSLTNNAPIPIPRDRNTAKSRRAKAVAALERIAARGDVKSVDDPVKWQKSIRSERRLPGRNK